MSYSTPESSLALANGRVKPETRILIVDNHSLSSELLKSQLKPEPNITVVGTATNELEAFAAIKQLDPNVVVIDFDIPQLNGSALIKKINYNFPRIKTVVFTNRNQSEHINQALSMGAKGFLIKNSHTKEVKGVLRTLTSDNSSDTKLQLPIANETRSDLVVNNGQVPQTSAIVPVSEAGLPAVIVEQEDWSGATKDLLDAMPRVWTRGLLYFLLIGTAIIVPWSILTEVDQTGTARGRLEPKNKVIHLDAPVAAKIEAITVKEGESVKKGAILAELESKIVSSELDRLLDERSGLKERLNQLEFMYLQSTGALNTKDQEIGSRLLEKESQIAQAQQSFDSLKASYESQKGEKLAQIEQAKQEIESSKAARKLAEVALRGAQEKAKNYKIPYEEGGISKDLYLDQVQQAEENQERLAQATAQMEQAKARLNEQENSYQNLIKQSESEIAQASLELEKQRRSYETLKATGKIEQFQTGEQNQELKSQITTIKSEIAQIDKQIESSRFQLKQRQLIAPADGIVFHIPARGGGAVVQPGEEMIKIAPKESKLILKAQIPPTDSGFLKKGMPVKVKFDAYPFQDYGVSEGKLISISPDSKVTETPQGQQETYELKVELDKPYILDGGKRVTLTAGQTATAEVIIRQRRVIDFFLDPFKKLQEDGMKL